MSLTMHLLVDQEDMDRLAVYMESIGERLKARQEILPILTKYFEPLAAQERSYLETDTNKAGDPHVISGALDASLTARSGSGDRAGTVSVFSAPTATTKTLMETWRGANGRKQQRGWQLKEKMSARQRVFYGPIVHQGHGAAKAYPFAQQAVDALGETNAEAAAQELLNHIVG